MQIVFAKICGWAYGFMITTNPVKKGIEVLYDYGHSYCECSMRLFATVISTKTVWLQGAGRTLTGWPHTHTQQSYLATSDEQVPVVAGWWLTPGTLLWFCI
jgi:hypothetical protein